MARTQSLSPLLGEGLFRSMFKGLREWWLCCAQGEWAQEARPQDAGPGWRMLPPFGHSGPANLSAGLLGLPGEHLGPQVISLCTQSASRDQQTILDNPQPPPRSLVE